MSGSDYVFLAIVLGALLGLTLVLFWDDIKDYFKSKKRNKFKYKGFIYLGYKQDNADKFIYQFENKKKEPFNLYGASHFRHSLYEYRKYDINCYNDRYLTEARQSEK